MPDRLAAAIAGKDSTEVVRALVEDSTSILRVGDVGELLRAAEVIAPDGGTLPVAAAWRVGFTLHLSGRLDEAIGWYERADPALPDAEPAEVAQLYAAHASTRWAQGRAADSRQLADVALATAEGCGDDAALGAAWVAQALAYALEGDRDSNRTSYAKALAAAERAGDGLTRVRVLCNMASLENEEGHYRTALRHLDDAVASWEPDLAAPLRALVCFNRAESLLGLGRVDEGVSELEQARSFARSAESPLLGLALLGLGDANRLRGNASQASAAYLEAVERAEATEQAQVLVPALAGLARSVLGEDLEQALGLAERALDQPAALGQVTPLLAIGWLRLAAGEREQAADHGQTAAREAGRRHDARGLAEALELQALAGPPDRAVDLLREAATLWEVTENRIGAGINAVLVARASADPLAEIRARRSLRSMGVRDDANRTAGALQVIGPPDTGQVTIRALGPFAVFRAGHPVPASEWQSQKARFALKILVGRGGRGISRDALCELLWPGKVDTGSRLSVVLSTLRSVLDPDREHASDHFVLADRESVRLSPATVGIDASQFAAASAEALRLARTSDPAAVEALELASAAYTGDFLEDDPYHPWAADVRDELRGLAGEVRRELVRALEVEDPERAVPWLLGLLSDDPYDESSHQRLIQIMHAAGRHGEARRAHRRYLINMAEIAVPTSTFAELVGGKR